MDHSGSLMEDLRRFLHWGPITFLTVTACTLWITLHMNEMWWAPSSSQSAYFNYIMIWFNLVGTIYNFLHAVIDGPGYLPRKWQPENADDAMYMQFCLKCDGYKAPRSHHCRQCDRCVMKMDHHCPWINNCVGWGNQKNFLLFLIFIQTGAIQTISILSCSFFRGLARNWLIRHKMIELATVRLTYYNSFATALCVGVAVGVFCASLVLLYQQLRTLFKNCTVIEKWILRKAKCRRDLDTHNLIPPFVFPYNLGLLNNVKEVFLLDTDGINWNVLPGCHQYSLTNEQLAQKMEKRARTQIYKCVRPATGYWVPFISQGLMVACQAPFTDDPRIVLKLGDRIFVTRHKSDWLYGEREITAEEKEHGIRKGHLRGWFPRRCVIRLDETFFGELGQGDFPKILDALDNESQGQPLEDRSPKDAPATSKSASGKQTKKQTQEIFENSQNMKSNQTTVPNQDAKIKKNKKREMKTVVEDISQAGGEPALKKHVIS